MSMTLWADIVGYTCAECRMRWATHWYGDWPICCSCHYGEDYRESDDFMEREAIRYNTLFQKGLPLEEEYILDDEILREELSPEEIESMELDEFVFDEHEDL